MKPKLQYAGAMAAFGTISLFVRSIPLSSGMLALMRAAIAAAFLMLLRAAAGRVGQPVLVRRLQIGRDRAVVDDEVRNVLHIFHVHIELRIDAQDELLGIVRGAIQQLAR